MFCASAPVLWVPLVATVPDQAPEAVQEVAFVELQVNVVDPPLVRLVEAALIETVGASEIAGDPPPPPHAAKMKPAAAMDKECFIASLF